MNGSNRFRLAESASRAISSFTVVNQPKAKPIVEKPSDILCADCMAVCTLSPDGKRWLCPMDIIERIKSCILGMIIFIIICTGLVAYWNFGSWKMVKSGFRIGAIELEQQPWSAVKAQGADNARNNYKSPLLKMIYSHLKSSTVLRTSRSTLYRLMWSGELVGTSWNRLPLLSWRFAKVREVEEDDDQAHSQVPWLKWDMLVGLFPISLSIKPTWSPIAVLQAFLHEIPCRARTQANRRSSAESEAAQSQQLSLFQSAETE